MEERTLQDIVSDIRNLNTIGENKPKSLFDVNTGLDNIQLGDKGKINAIKHIRPLDTIYDRLNDGSYSTKFENYAGLSGDEDRLGQEQSWLEQWGHGITKAVSKTFNYALDATVGTVYGVFEGISKGSLSAVWDNDFSKTIDDWNTKLDNNLANYYTDEQKSAGVLSSMLTANFWANDFLGGLAFVGGALLPEAAIALATGGATLPGSIAKLGLKTGAKAVTKSLLKEGVGTTTKKVLKKASEKALRSEGKAIQRTLTRTEAGRKTGQALSTGRFLLQSSNFEAGMEARHNYKDAIDNYFTQFREKNGRSPSTEEFSTFAKSATTAANAVYGTNLAILSLSNAAMFRNIVRPNKVPTFRKNVDNFLAETIGLGAKTTKGGKLVVKPLTKKQKLLGNAFKIAEKPAIEGLYEEGFQGVAGKTMQNYLEGLHDPNNTDGLSFMSSLTEAFSEQYGSKEGWKEMVVGMLIGSVGGTLSGGSIAGVGKDSYGRKRKALEEAVEASNKGMKGLQTLVEVNKKGIGTVRGLSKAGMAKKAAERGEGSQPSLENTLLHKQFIETQSSTKDQKTIKEDFSFTVDSMKLSEEEVAQLDKEGISEEDFKTGIKEEFAQSLESYNKAKNFVDALDLKGTEITPGETVDAKDSLLYTVMVGQTAGRNAKKVGEEIDNLIGSSGMADFLGFYSGLSSNRKNSLKQLSAKNRNLKTLRRKAIDIQQQLAGIQPKANSQTKDTTLKNKFDKTTTKLVATTQAITNLEQEISDLESSLDLDYREQQINVDKVQSVSFFTSAQAVEELDKLDVYEQSLRKAGKTREANALSGLRTEFAAYSDYHNEVLSVMQEMSDPEYFSGNTSKELFRNLRGNKYEPSEEFLEAIRDNENLFDKVLSEYGIRTDKSVVEDLKTLLEKNDQLSEREKFQLERALRLQLTTQASERITEDLLQLKQEVEPVEVEDSKSDINTDTIAKLTTVEKEGKSFSAKKVFKEKIEDILKELDYLRTQKIDQRRVEKLQTELEKLEKDLSNLEAKSKESNKSKIARETVEELNKQLEEEKKLEEPNEETIKDIQKDIKTESKKIVEPELSEEDQEKKVGFEQKIAEIKEQLKNFVNRIRIVDSEDYKRLNTLFVKEIRDEITEEEVIELEELREDIDQWLLLTGTSVGKTRLSEIIKQKVALEKLSVKEEEVINEITEEEVIKDIEFEEATVRNNYTFGQFHGAVTARYDAKRNIVVVSGVRPDEVQGIFSQGKGENKTSIDFDYSVDEDNNNILIPLDELSKINTQESNISILPTNEDLTSQYNVVIQHTVNMQGGNVSQPLQSNYSDDYTETQDESAVYALEKQSELFLKVDTRDEYNQEIIEELRKVRSKNENQEDILERLATKLRLTVFDSEGNFVSTLKGKKTGESKTNQDLAFEAFRDSLKEDEFIDALLASEGLLDLDTPQIKVEKVLVGHPNFNFKKNGDGTVSIVSSEVNDNKTNTIKDIGLVEDSTIKTKSGILNIDTTFLNRKIKKQPKGKIPFIVINKGGKDIAYPVTIKKDAAPDTSNLENILSSELEATEKAIKLNKSLAEMGIDINKEGNFFFNIGDSNNLTKEFLSDKIDQIEEKVRIPNLEDWTSSKDNMKEVIQNQILVNIDLSNPVHSPKVIMDMSEIFAKFKPTNVSNVKNSLKDNQEVEKGIVTPKRPKKGSLEERYSNLPSEEEGNKNNNEEINNEC